MLRTAMAAAACLALFGPLASQAAPLDRPPFHGGDSVPAGTFHGGDTVPPGTFHANTETQASALRQQEVAGE